MNNQEIVSSLPKYLDGFNLFLGAEESFEDELEEATLPTITAKTEEFQSGSGLAPIKVPVGFESQEMDFSIAEPSDTILTRVGTREFAIFRGSLASQQCNQEESYIIKVFGLIEKYEGGTAKANEMSGKIKFTMSIDTILFEREGSEVFYLNNVTGEKRIFGEECTRKRRVNLGTNS